MKKITSQSALLCFLLFLGWNVAHGQDETDEKISFVVKVVDRESFLKPLEKTIEVSSGDLKGGKIAVVNLKMEDMSGGEYVFQVSVKARPVLEKFNIYYNPSIKGDERKVPSSQFNRFDNERGERQHDLFNLTFVDEKQAKKYEASGQLVVDGTQEWVLDVIRPQVTITQEKAGPASSSGPVELEALKAEHLAKLPYIQEIWGDVKDPATLKSIPPEKFEEFFQKLKERNWDEVLNLMGIHNGFESLPIITKLYDTFSSTSFDGNADIKKKYPILKNYGVFYYALLGKNPIEVQELYKKIKDINGRIKSGEKIEASDLNTLNEAAMFIARAAIMSRHGGLFYVYSDAIIRNNPYFVEKLQSKGTEDPGLCSSEALKGADDELTKKLEGFAAIMKANKEAKRKRDALYHYLSMMQGQSSFGMGDPEQIFHDGFNKVEISGGNNRCWMRATWFSIFDHFKDNPEGLAARVKEIFKGVKMDDEVEKFLADAPKILNTKETSRFGIQSNGKYSDNAEEAIFLITRQILLNEKAKFAKAHEDFSNELAVKATQLAMESESMPSEERAKKEKELEALSTKADLQKEFMDDQENMLSEMRRGTFGGNEVMTSMYEAIVGLNPREHQHATLLVVSSSGQDVSIVGSPEKQLGVIKKDLGGTIDRPVIYGNGVHFSIFEPKPK